MYIWKINGLPDGVWVVSEQGANYDLIPEGDMLRILNIDNRIVGSFCVEPTNIKSVGDKLIIETPDEDIEYVIGLNTGDLVALNELDSGIRDGYIDCVTANACIWLSEKLGMLTK